jgi:hypothetical protein
MTAVSTPANGTPETARGQPAEERLRERHDDAQGDAADRAPRARDVPPRLPAPGAELANASRGGLAAREQNRREDDGGQDLHDQGPMPRPGHQPAHRLADAGRQLLGQRFERLRRVFAPCSGDLLRQWDSATQSGGIEC